jgi:O-antigen/teichoic acid export membrane protein
MTEQTATTRALWSAIDAVANPISALVTLGGLVRTLSAPDYGILVIALAASSISMAVNPAIATTTTKFISELAGLRNPRGRTAAGVITTSLIVVIIIDLVLLLGTALFDAPLSHFVFGTADSSHLQEVLFLAVLAVGIQQVDVVLAAAIRGLEHFKQQALFEIAFRVALTGSVVAVAWRTGSAKQVLLAQCLVCLVSCALRGAYLRALLPQRRLLKLSNRAEVGMLFRYGSWMWVAAIAGVLYMSADRIIVGRVLGVTIAGQYNIYVQLAQLIHFVPSSLFAFAFPAFSRLAAQGTAHEPQFARAYRTYLGAICALALGVALVIMLPWGFLLNHLAGISLGAKQWLASGLLALGFLVLAFNIAPYYLLLALGRAKAVSIISTVSMMGSLVLMIVLVPRFGLVGAAIARLSYGVVTLAFHVQARTAMTAVE